VRREVISSVALEDGRRNCLGPSCLIRCRPLQAAASEVNLFDNIVSHCQAPLPVYRKSRSFFVSWPVPAVNR